MTKLRAYVEQNGFSCLTEKIAITELEPRRNAARFLLAALCDEFKMPIRNAAKKRQVPPAPLDQPPPEPNLEPMSRLWSEASELQRMAWLEDDFLRRLAPKGGEAPGPIFLARPSTLSRASEAAG